MAHKRQARIKGAYLIRDAGRSRPTRVNSDSVTSVNNEKARGTAADKEAITVKFGRHSAIHCTAANRIKSARPIR